MSKKTKKVNPDTLAPGNQGGKQGETQQQYFGKG